MKNQFIKILLVLVLFLSVKQIVFADNVTLTVRDESNVIFSGTVAIPTDTTSLNDASSVSHTVDASSVLATVDSASLQSGSNFSISNLAYFSSFNSLYLKCITDTGGEKCDNWQFTVNNLYPSVGMDQKILSDGDNVYLYFGPQNRVILSSANVNTNDTLTITAQNYDYQNDTWTTRTGVTVGLTQPDPNNPFSPIEIKTGGVDVNGQIVFTSIPVGNYNVGIKEDFYFPTESLTVITYQVLGSGGGELITIPTTPAISNSVASNATPIVPAKPIFDIKKAFDFLTAQLQSDGSFGESLYTDWTAVALGSGNSQDQVLKLVKYFSALKIDSMSLTDYERHAMALMTLGLNPYDTNGENYIEKITASFDGKQFGDIHEDNDDIFALIVLQNAGYTQNDKIINDDVSFVLGAQNEDGSWDSSVDMTGAAIEALSAFSSNTGVKNALIKSENFLRLSQKSDASWGENVSSTAWALEGILALNEKPEDWIKGGSTPLDYLANTQDTDGGVKVLPAQTGDDFKNKIWETAYVASVLSGKTWNQVMQKFEKPQSSTIAEVPTKIVKKTYTKTAVKTETPKVNWFTMFLEHIFGF